MAIQEYFNKNITRRNIVFFEEDPPTDAIEYLKEYQLHRFNISDFEKPEQLNDIAAVIFRQRKDKLHKIKNDLKQYAEIPLRHDCRVFVIVPEKIGLSIQPRKTITEAIDEGQLPVSGLQRQEEESLFGSDANDHKLIPMVHIIDAPNTWSDVARYLQDYPPDVLPSLALKIEAFDEYNERLKLSCEQRILIQRAFHDCSIVKLVRNPGGHSGVDTYRAYATHVSDYLSQVSPYMLFVKVGKRKLISKEYLAYRDIAMEHIPFHLGPRIRLDRCALGAQQGIIVSDYVSGSEKLHECARSGRAVAVIASLFNTTLRAWYKGWREVDKPLQDYLKEKMPLEIPEHRRSLIKSLGSSKGLTELKHLLEKTSSRPVKVGVVHGDLHTRNVLVRGGDAIVIDFEKVERNFPLLFDLASLEAGLFVDGFIGDLRTKEDLLESIDCLYEVNTLINHHLVICETINRSAWYFDCVRQIRMQAREIELVSKQYALTVATVLAKKSCSPHIFPTEPAEKGLSREVLRALAYILAERILVKLSNTNEESHTG